MNNSKLYSFDATYAWVIVKYLDFMQIICIDNGKIFRFHAFFAWITVKRTYSMQFFAWITVKHTDFMHLTIWIYAWILLKCAD